MQQHEEQIARVCHEANRAYCQTIGDNSQPAWEDAPDWQKDSARNGVRAHLERDVSPSESHDLWLAQKRAEGWKFGPVKDAGKREHPCFVEYDALPEAQRRKDAIFRNVVHAFKAAL